MRDDVKVYHIFKYWWKILFLRGPYEVRRTMKNGSYWWMSKQGEGFDSFWTLNKALEAIRTDGALAFLPSLPVKEEKPYKTVKPGYFNVHCDM